MKVYLIILFSILTINILAQSSDSLKNSIPYNNINIFYERNTNIIIINGTNENTQYTIQLYDITGTPIINTTIYAINKTIEFPIILKNGIYIIIIKYQNFTITKKFKVNN